MFRLAALAVLLAAPVLASAQPGSTTRVGLGVRLGTDVLQFNNGSGPGIAPSPQFSIPIDVNGSIRVEPEIGYISLSNSSTGNFSRSSRQTALGLAVSALVPAEDLTLTIGARARYIRLTSEFANGGSSLESTVTALGIGPVVGGEYPFSDRFALGAEAGVQYVTFSDDDDTRDDASVIATTAALSARFFF